MYTSLNSIDFIKNLNSGSMLLICGFVAVIALNRKSFFSKTVLNFVGKIRIFLEDLVLTCLAGLWVLTVVCVLQSASMIYKWFLSMYLKLRYGWMAKTIDCLDVIGIVENDDTPIVITSLKVLNGIGNLVDLRHRINITVSKTNSLGCLTYPKFFQTLEQISGYHCWKPAKYDIDHHVRILDGLEVNDLAVSESRVLRLVSAIAKRKFEKGRSPWEVLLVPSFHYDNEKPEKVKRSAIIIRIHHAIGDGYSFLKLIIRETSLPSEPKVDCHPIPTTPKTRRMSLLKGIIVFFYLTFKATRALLVETFARDDNPLFENRTLSGKTVLTWSQPMKLDFLKTVRDSSGVGLTTVFITALTSAVRKYMNEEFKLTPNSISAVVPFPAPNHPDNKMTNKFSFVRFPLPNLVEDPINSLQLMEVEARKLAAAPDGLMNLLLLQMVGILPTNLIRAFLRNKQSTLIISNLPGPTQKISIWGKELNETMFWLPPMGVSGISASFLSYNSKFRLGLAVDTGIITDGQTGAERLIQGFIESIVAIATAKKLPLQRLFPLEEEVRKNKVKSKRIRKL